MVPSALLAICELHVCTAQDPELNPALGVPGFPDCVRQGVPATSDFIGSAKALYCNERPGPPDAIKIACVGDSITAGAWARNRENTYPAQLQKILDEKYGPGTYTVTNLGAAGSVAQVLPGGQWLSYVDTPQFDALARGNFDIVVLMIGTNDANENTWPANCNANTAGADCSFSFDFSQIIKKIKEHAQRVIVITPSPIMSTDPLHWGIHVQVVNQYFPFLIPTLASQNGVESADMYTFMGGLPTWPSGYPEVCLPDEQFWQQYSSCRFYCSKRHCDGVHPSDQGYHHMASALESVISGGTPILQ